MPRFAKCLLACSLILVTCSFAAGDEISDAKAALDKLNLKSSGTNLVFTSEAEFIKTLEKMPTFRKSLVMAAKENDALQNYVGQAKQAATNLKMQEVQLSAQLANVKSVSDNNRLVGALKAIEGQGQLLQSQREELDKKDKEVRGKLNKAREDFIQFTLDLRKQADGLTAQYEAKKSDAEVKAAVAQASKAAKREYVFGPSPTFTAAIKRLKTLEDTVLSESIPLQRKGDTYFVSVVVGGKHTQEMVLDSGASTIALPNKIAEDFGLRVNPSTDQEVILVLADGSQIKGYKKTLPSVRVGKFTVDNVECVVLAANAVNAEPLLGMSFLGNFKFEINAAASTLTMVKVTGEGGK